MRSRPIAAGASRDAVAALLAVLAEMEPDGSGLVLAIDPHAAPNLLARHLGGARTGACARLARRELCDRRCSGRLRCGRWRRDVIRSRSRGAAQRFMRETGVIYGLRWGQLANAAAALAYRADVAGDERGIGLRRDEAV